ncbi:MAG TPA: NADH-quinone oxidoreductase subunit N [Cytophagales bacterium]|nr:NADH-quinone oxidoreductase subunit N [Cytophagales bacterium]
MLTNASSSISGKLELLLDSLGYIMPEIVLSVGFIALILFGLIFKKHAAIGALGSVSIFFLTIYFDYQQWIQFSNQEGKTLFLGLIKLDSLAIYFKFLFEISGILVVVLTYFYTDKLRKSLSIEYYSIITAIVLGAHIMTMSVNLLSTYISIELVSLSSYILTGFLFNKNGAEAGIKYLLFGALSTAIMLYGMSLLYGFSGTLNFTSPDFYENLQLIPLPALIIALTLTICGFLFKASLVPFHLWTPDIYEASPTPVVAFFSVVPKAAAFVILARFINSNFLSGSEMIFEALAVVAIVSMFLGNLGAIGQKNIKRMLAYSSIAQAGFILVGLLAESSWGFTTMAFYITVYLIMNFAAFLLVQILQNITGSENMQDFKGLGLQYAFIGVSMVVVMISLAGFPPTAGFLAKLFIFSALWEAYQSSASTLLLWVFILGLLNLIISMFYYLKVPFLMFFKTQEGNRRWQPGWKEYFSLTILIIPLLILFFKSDKLIHIINSIALNFN